MKYFIIYADSGYGHRRVAEYIAEEFAGRKLSGQVHCINFLEHAPLSCQLWYPALYRWLVTYARWLWALIFYLNNLRWFYGFTRFWRSLGNRKRAKGFIAFLLKEQPDVIITTHFLPAEICANLKRQRRLNATVISLVTDFLVHAVWVAPGIDHYAVAAEETKAGLLSWGVPKEKIGVYGIPVSSQFRLSYQKSFYRDQYGLKADRFTVLIMGGGFGIGRIKRLVAVFDKYFYDAVQVVVVCGRNDKLKKSLCSATRRLTLKIFGYVQVINELMEASDLLITKAGGLTVCEGLAKDLPIVIFDPIPGQEAYNTRFLLERKAAIYLKPIRKLKAVTKLILNDPKVLVGLKENARAVNNLNAASEIVDFMLVSSQNNRGVYGASHTGCS